MNETLYLPFRSSQASGKTREGNNASGCPEGGRLRQLRLLEAERELAGTKAGRTFQAQETV